MRHSPDYDKHIKRQVCQKCGLVYLRNRRTDQAVRAACPGKEDQ